MDVKIERFGEKTEIVHSLEHIANPVIGYVIEDSKGWMALPTSGLKPPTKHDGRGSAIDYIAR